jgi:hypothetical protein
MQLCIVQNSMTSPNRSGAGFAWLPAAAAAGTYPPGLTGLRGSHPGAIDAGRLGLGTAGIAQVRPLLQK